MRRLSSDGPGPGMDRQRDATVTGLAELALFTMDFGDRTGYGQECRTAVVNILTAQLLPLPLDRHAALYGYAYEIGATRDPAFDPAWKPLDCV